MTTQECLQILRDVKDVAFATVDENGFPQIRIIDVMLIEQEKLYFCTARGKDFYRQLMRDGRVAITGMNSAYQAVRLSGNAIRLPQQETWLDRIFVANPSMNNVYPGDSRSILEAFCIENGQMELVDLGQKQVFRESFAMGNTRVQEKGFLITDACIACGVCSRNCPQRCISVGTPFLIEQKHCLHCGRCQELCPVQAIRRRGCEGC